jgi:hypothetical protein
MRIIHVGDFCIVSVVALAIGISLESPDAMSVFYPVKHISPLSRQAEGHTNANNETF